MMANFYFEVGSKYFIANKDIDSNFGAGTYILMNRSSRVWCEQDGHVWFTKNRTDPTTEVDMKEFMWVKLSAETVHG